MSKKIIVICREIPSQVGSAYNVDSRMYNEDESPIIRDSKHVGQISSSFGWAVRDLTYHRYKSELDELFPEVGDQFIFEYRFIHYRQDL